MSEKIRIVVKKKITKNVLISGVPKIVGIGLGERGMTDCDNCGHWDEEMGGCRILGISQGKVDCGVPQYYLDIWKEERELVL